MGKEKEVTFNEHVELIGDQGVVEAVITGLSQTDNGDVDWQWFDPDTFEGLPQREATVDEVRQLVNQGNGIRSVTPVN